MKNWSVFIIIGFLIVIFFIFFQMMKQKEVTGKGRSYSSFWDRFFKFFGGKKSYGCVAGFEWSEEHQACVPIPGYW